MNARMVAMAGVAVVAMACGGSSEPAQSTAQLEARATLDASIATAEKAGVSNAAREYAAELCAPLSELFDEFVDIAPALESADASEDVGSILVLMRALKEPVEGFVDDLEGVEPPREFQEYHQAFLAQMLYAVEAIGLVEEGGILAALALGDPPPEVEEPPELQDAMVLECGEEFAEFLESGELLDFFGEEDSPSEAIASGDEVALGTPIVIPAESLPSYLFDDSRNTTGAVTVTFTGFEPGITSVEDDPYPCGGTEYARGQFVAVFFTFDNNLTETIRMSSVVNSETRLQDDIGRNWERAEVVRSDLCVLEPNVSAQYADGEQIAARVGPGFSEKSAIVFDIPTDATGLVLIEAITKTRIPLE